MVELDFKDLSEEDISAAGQTLLVSFGAEYCQSFLASLGLQSVRHWTVRHVDFYWHLDGLADEALRRALREDLPGSALDALCVLLPPDGWTDGRRSVCCECVSDIAKAAEVLSVPIPDIDELYWLPGVLRPSACATCGMVIAV